MVGAGILALPGVASKPGFILSSLLVIFSWIASSFAGLLIAEAWCTAQIRGSQTSIEAMAKEWLGEYVGKAVGIGFLLYNLALLVAYTAEGGTILQDLVHFQITPAAVPTGTGISLSDSTMPLGTFMNTAQATITFAVGLGTVLLLGKPDCLKRGNNVLVAAAMLSFSALLANQIPAVSIENLTQRFGDLTSIIEALPVIVISLSYQNVMPVVAAQLDGDKESIRKSVLLGTGVPVLMYIAWIAASLGSTFPGCVSVDATASSVTGGGTEPTIFIGDETSSDVKFVGLEKGCPELSSMVDSANSGSPVSPSEDSALILKKTFSLAALVTSFIGCTFGQVEELAARGIARIPNPEEKEDEFAMQLESKEPLYWDQIVQRERFLLYLLALSPPTIIAATASNMFLPALQASGGILAPLLYGLSPALMVWAQRYENEAVENNQKKEADNGFEVDKDDGILVPGGKLALLGMATGSLALATQSLIRTFHFSAVN
eukprot:CAMPEP_0114493290 /NCGR_PEP_ID=MMETSP0109-20121206/4029_1 /TAXON_ID=29199 /ORGANISM="Chlorarachnion reptans, Strain CCCM449" /LENGTH=489 /DNA_ID=CAMNT_0001670229 /DNA_START=365 /DNA_END=1834 /DNA_ORIENTATION=+